MSKKYPPTAHIRLPASIQAYIEKRCRELNKASIDDEQKWDRSKFIRWLIRREMKGELTPTMTPQQHARDNQGDDTSYYDSLLNECYRR